MAPHENEQPQALGLNRQKGTHLGDPQRTADVHPLGPAAGGLHRSSFLGTQQTLGLNAQGARPAQPAALWDLEDSVAGL